MKFVDTLFNGKMFSDPKVLGSLNNIAITLGQIKRKQIISFLEQLFKQFPEMTPRLLKLILRKANMIYKNQIAYGHKPDFRVTICIEASRYFEEGINDNLTYFDKFRKSKSVSAKTLFAAFFAAIVDKRVELTQENQAKLEELIRPKKDFLFIDRKTKEEFPSEPYIGHRQGFWIDSFYFNN